MCGGLRAQRGYGAGALTSAFFRLVPLPLGTAAGFGPWIVPADTRLWISRRRPALTVKQLAKASYIPARTSVCRALPTSATSGFCFCARGMPMYQNLLLICYTSIFALAINFIGPLREGGEG